MPSALGWVPPGIMPEDPSILSRARPLVNTGISGDTFSWFHSVQRTGRHVRKQNYLTAVQWRLRWYKAGRGPGCRRARWLAAGSRILADKRK